MPIASVLFCLASVLAVEGSVAHAPRPEEVQDARALQNARPPASARDVPQEINGLPLVFSSRFQELSSEEAVAQFEFTDEAAWRMEEVQTTAGMSLVLSQHKQSDYTPTHRSPLNMALLKEVDVADFVLTARVKSTIADYGHRDVCVFFGHQDAEHFYYVHLGKETDDHANQIFIVNDAPRIKISSKTTEGTPWDDQWHDIKIVRKTAEGTIHVYFDDMVEPVMTATDKSFLHGRVGFGSFDDTTQWDKIRLHGNRAQQEDKTADRGQSPIAEFNKKAAPEKGGG